MAEPLLDAALPLRLIDFEDGGDTPVYAAACPRTLCSAEPMWARLIGFDPDGAEVWAAAPDCYEYPTSEPGFWGFIHPELWPPYGIPAVVGVHYEDVVKCGSIKSTTLAVYDDAADGWIAAGGDFFMQLTGFGVLSFQQGGCVDPPENWSVNIADDDVCAYPLRTPPHEINAVIRSEVPGENGGCCDCYAEGDAATFSVHVEGFSDGVRAARLADYRNGVEEWASGNCCGSTVIIPCCCDPPEEMIVEVIASDDCPCAVGALGSLVWAPVVPWADNGMYLGSIEVCGILIELALDCVGSEAEWNHWRLFYNRYIDWPGDPCDDPTGGGPESPGDPSTWSQQADPSIEESSCEPLGIVFGQTGSPFGLGFPPCPGMCEPDPIGNPGLFTQGEVKLRFYSATEEE